MNTLECKADNIELYHGDCLNIMPNLPEHSIDLVVVDLPYGTTACDWDSIIPLDKMWKELLRVCKENTAIIFTAQQPFTWKLCASQPKMFRYELIWKKPNGTNPFQAQIMPMKKHENILIFYNKKPTYNPQMVEGKPYKWNSTRSGGKAGGIKQLKETPIDNHGNRYPSSVLEFKQERKGHPTQKPVELMSWIIKTYSNPNDCVLDFTMGSGTTGVAAIVNNRKFIGIELDDKYFNMAKNRMSING
jgi:site-specific DNA-methyltransferase (adenine-specific)